MYRISVFLFVLFVGLIFSGCNDISTTKLDFRTVERTQSSKIINQRFVVVKDSNTWKNLWAEHIGNNQGFPMPEVNFSQEIVLGVFLGVRSNTCFWVTIESVEQISNQRLLVKYREQKKGSVCGRAETEPTHLIAIASSDLKIEFVELD